MARRAKNDPDAPELSIETIVGAAIEVIDNEGLDAFSLRALARHIGAGNMRRTQRRTGWPRLRRIERVLR